VEAEYNLESKKLEDRDPMQHVGTS
jgi:hypothetical protein